MTGEGTAVTVESRTKAQASISNNTVYTGGSSPDQIKLQIATGNIPLEKMVSSVAFFVKLTFEMFVASGNLIYQ